jgi:broad specificity phosphatase PhoE
VSEDSGRGTGRPADDGRAAQDGQLTAGAGGVADAPRIVLAARRDGPAALWLIRHGQSEGNVVRDEAERQQAEEYVLGGRDADVPLSDLGRDQAEAFGRWLREQPAELHPDVVLVSPYLRAAQTTDLVLDAAGLQGLPRGVDERLRDREMGQWDGLTWRGIVARHPEEAERAKLVGRFFHRPPGGESWADMCLRLRSLLADVAQELSGRRVLVVAHDVVIQLTRVLLDGMSEAEAVDLIANTTYANCALTTLERDGHGLGLERYNWTVPVREQGEQPTRSTDAPAGR